MNATITHKNPGALKKVYETIQAASKRVVAVGFPRDKQNAYPDGTPVAMVAAIQVYGSPAQNIPSRDFMGQARPDMVRHQKEVAAKADGISVGQVELDALLTALGEFAVDDIKTTIKKGAYEPLKERTMAARDRKQGMKEGAGDYTPLIDTHHMIDSVTYSVRDKED